MTYVNRFIPAVVQPKEIEVPSLWFAFRGRRLLVQIEGRTAQVPYLTDFAQLELTATRKQYLGTLNGKHCYSIEVEVEASPPQGWSFQGLRRLFDLMSEEVFWVASAALQIVDWDRNHQFCSHCGTGTVYRAKERAKECPICGLLSYPRISPAIIVLVERDDSLLLARSVRRPKGLYSVLAGFVEPGETLETAVKREIREEVGISVTDIRYFGSQPWPFPDSLMIAFTCKYASGELQLEEEEIVDAGWYTAESLPPIPPRISIARSLIEWFIFKQTKHTNG